MPVLITNLEFGMEEFRTPGDVVQHVDLNGKELEDEIDR